LGQALEKRAQRTAGCGRCQNLVIDYRIQTPGEFRKALRVVRANLDDRTIVLLGSEESERAFDLTEAGPWPDFIEHEFQCSSCGQVFRLGVETYHGAGGEWAPVA
jgi:hypothetical protein